jgi:lysophospholipase L1-like esterase
MRHMTTIKTILNRSAHLTIVLVMLMVFLGTNLVFGFDPLESPFYDPDAVGCDSTTFAGGPSGISNTVYVMGDSLTVGMNSASLGQESLQNILISKGWAPTINAQGGRPLYNANNTPIVYSGTTITTAYDEFDGDSNAIAGAGAVIIALGTNNYEGTEAVFKAKALEYIAKIEAVNTTIGNNIYWENTHTNTSGSKSERAATIAAVVQESGIKLIDYRTDVTTNPTKYPYQTDGIHLTDAGYKAKAKFTADAISAAPAVGGASGSGGGAYDPTALTYPAFPDEAKIVQGIEDTIKARYASSPWIGLGQWILDTSKANNVNPLFIVASGGVESGFGNSTWGRDNNNYFGIDQGHKQFPTPKDGIQYFIEVIPKNLAGEGASGRYKDVRNIYEYSSIHQTGSIVYPGQPFDPRDVDTKPGITDKLWDNTMKVWVSWDPRANDGPEVNPKYKGNTYNPLGYYKANISIINQITGLTLPTEPSGSGTTVAATSTCGTTAGTAGANGWDLPGEGDHPMTYYSQMREASAPSDAAVQGYFGDSPYGKGTIAGCGCGPTSWAMIVSTLTPNKVEPTAVAAWAAENGYRSGSEDCSGSAWWWTSAPAASEAKWGVKAHQIQLEEAAAYLQQGKLIMVSVGEGSVLLSPGGDGHLLVMRAITADGKYLFADPSDSQNKRNTGGDGNQPDIFKELGSSRTPLDAPTVSTGLKALFVVEAI